VIPEPQNSEALVHEPGIAFAIICIFIVLTTIALDDEFRTKVYEIHNVGP
jgi:hypothetical protein